MTSHIEPVNIKLVYNILMRRTPRGDYEYLEHLSRDQNDSVTGRVYTKDRNKAWTMTRIEAALHHQEGDTLVTCTAVL